MRYGWAECRFKDLLNFEQTTNYIVKITKLKNIKAERIK